MSMCKWAKGTKKVNSAQETDVGQSKTVKEPASEDISSVQSA